MKFINRIVTLTFVAITLSFLLFGFVTSNYRELTSEISEEPAFYCGTAYLESNQEPNLSDPAILQGHNLFRANCRSCHKIHEMSVGPALAGIMERRDSLWVRKMIIDGTALRKSGDKEAIKLFKEYKNLRHTSFTSLSKEDVDALMTYLTDDAHTRGIP